MLACKQAVTLQEGIHTLRVFLSEVCGMDHSPGCAVVTVLNAEQLFNHSEHSCPPCQGTGSFVRSWSKLGRIMKRSAFVMCVPCNPQHANLTLLSVIPCNTTQKRTIKGVRRLLAVCCGLHFPLWMSLVPVLLYPHRGWVGLVGREEEKSRFKRERRNEGRERGEREGGTHLGQEVRQLWARQWSETQK